VNVDWPQIYLLTREVCLLEATLSSQRRYQLLSNRPWNYGTIRVRSDIANNVHLCVGRVPEGVRREQLLMRGRGRSGVRLVALLLSLPYSLLLPPSQALLRRPMVKLVQMQPAGEIRALELGANLVVRHVGLAALLQDAVLRRSVSKVSRELLELTYVFSRPAGP